MDPLTAFIIYAVVFIATELLRPKPEIEDAKAATFEEFSIPTTDPKRAISVVWGRTRVKSPGIVWYGDYFTKAITETVKTGLFSKKKVTTGYKYNIGVQLGVARAVDYFEAFDWDDERLVTFSPEIQPPAGGTLVNIDERDFLGGEEGAAAGGGVVGNFRFYRGGPTQEVSGYLAQFQTPFTPAYRHLAHVVYEGVEVGTQPRIAPPAFIVKRYPNQLGLPGGEHIVGTGANPAAVIYEILTDDDFSSITIDASDINVTNFRDIGHRLFLENHGYSNNWAQKSEAKAVIDDILRQIDATLFMEFTTGQFEMRLVREPGSESPQITVPIFNETNIVQIDSFRRVNWSETSNRVVVNWKDPDLAQTPSPAVQDDMANQRIQGRNVVATFNHPGIDNATLAAEVCARELRAGAFPQSFFSLVANRDAIDLRPGDWFEFQWDELGIDSMIVRVLAVAVGDSIEARVRLDVAQDVYALGDTVYQAPQPTLWVNPATQTALPTLADKVFEAPLFLDRLATLISPSTASTDRDSRIVLLPVPNQQNTIGFRLNVAGPGSPADPDLEQGDFPSMAPSGLLTDPISEADFITATSPSTITLSGFNNFRALVSAVPADITAELANLFIIDDEFFSFESAVLNTDGTVTLSNIHRAKLDSLPKAHTASPTTRAFFMGLGPDLFAGGITDVRFTPNTGGGVAARPNTSRGRLDPSLANVIAFTATERIRRPYPVKNLEIEVPAVSSESPAITVSPALPAAPYVNRLNLPRADWIFTWDNRDRTALSDPDYDAATSQALEASTQIVIEFRSDVFSPLLRRQVISTAETFTYLVSQQDLDFGGPGSPEPGPPLGSPQEQNVLVRIYTRRTDSPALESRQRFDFTIVRTVA